MSRATGSSPHGVFPLQRWRMLLKRLGWALFTILFVVILNFFLFRIMPGDPARQGIRDTRLSPETI